MLLWRGWHCTLSPERAEEEAQDGPTTCNRFEVKAHWLQVSSPMRCFLTVAPSRVFPILFFEDPGGPSDILLAHPHVCFSFLFHASSLREVFLLLSTFLCRSFIFCYGDGFLLLIYFWLRVQNWILARVGEWFGLCSFALSLFPLFRKPNIPHTVMSLNTLIEAGLHQRCSKT
ncbi:hypothetical protein V8C34DRAFT_174387 [Trichoderma compactum]